MAEIFKFPEKKREPEKDPEKKIEHGRVNFAEKFTETIVFLTQLMQSDSRAYSPENITERRRALAGWDDNNLRLAILDGDNLHWTKEPSWYLAVIEEIRARGLVGERK